MNSFDDVMKKFSAVANKAVKKSSDMAETGKLKMKISAADKKLKELYEKVGRAVYEDCAVGGPMPDYVRDDCVEIYNQLQAIGEMESQIEAIKQEEAMAEDMECDTENNAPEGVANPYIASQPDEAKDHQE